MNVYDRHRVDKYVKKSWNNFLKFIDCLEERKMMMTDVKTNPFVMYLDPTSFCNLQCPFCATGQRINARKSTSLSLEHFKKIIDFFGSELFHITLYSWGEPMLNNDFLKMVKYTQKYNISTDISTNLNYSLTIKNSESLVTSGLDKIIMSVDGITQETYQKYRIGGKLELVFQNMKLLANAKKNTNSKIELVWRFLVFKYNQDEIKEAKSIADKIGIKIDFEPGFYDPKEKDQWKAKGEFSRDFWPYDDEKIIITQESQMELSQEKAGTLLPNLHLPNGCDWLWFGTSINADQSISPCCVTPFDYQDFGFFDSSNFLQSRNNLKYTNARKFTTGKIVNEKEQIICKRCPSVEIWHMLDETIIPIFKAILTKLPKEYDNFKKLEPIEISPQGNLTHYFIFPDISWELVGWLKAIILKEMEEHSDKVQNNGTKKAINQLYQVYTERIDLQTSFPEIKQGNIKNIISWADTYGVKEDQRLSRYSRYYAQ